VPALSVQADKKEKGPHCPAAATPSLNRSK
jgi:hypothetical protein